MNIRTGSNQFDGTEWHDITMIIILISFSYSRPVKRRCWLRCGSSSASTPQLPLCLPSTTRASMRFCEWKRQAVLYASMYYVFNCILKSSKIHFSVLCGDFVYVIVFPQLLLVLYFNKANTYGSVFSFVIGLALRLLCELWIYMKTKCCSIIHTFSFRRRHLAEDPGHNLFWHNPLQHISRLHWERTSPVPHHCHGHIVDHPLGAQSDYSQSLHRGTSTTQLWLL